jgi:hypothetical protein
MDEESKARFLKIENLLSAFMESLAAAEVAAEKRQAEWEKRQAEWEKRQERLERRVDRFARAGLAEVRRNRAEHDRIFKTLDSVALRLSEMTDKLNAMIKIEQDRQPPQQ